MVLPPVVAQTAELHPCPTSAFLCRCTWRWPFKPQCSTWPCAESGSPVSPLIVYIYRNTKILRIWHLLVTKCYVKKSSLFGVGGVENFLAHGHNTSWEVPILEQGTLGNVLLSGCLCLGNGRGKGTAGFWDMAENRTHSWAWMGTESMVGCRRHS